MKESAICSIFILISSYYEIFSHLPNQCKFIKLPVLINQSTNLPLPHIMKSTQRGKGLLRAFENQVEDIDSKINLGFRYSLSRFRWPCGLRLGLQQLDSWVDYILITNLMHWLLFIHKIIFFATCFEPQVLIFRRTQLYTCNIWYCHSL